MGKLFEFDKKLSDHYKDSQGKALPPQARGCSTYGLSPKEQVKNPIRACFTSPLWGEVDPNEGKAFRAGSGEGPKTSTMLSLKEKPHIKNNSPEKVTIKTVHR